MWGGVVGIGADESWLVVVEWRRVVVVAGAGERLGSGENSYRGNCDFWGKVRLLGQGETFGAG